jgi:hypothetical protein
MTLPLGVKPVQLVVYEVGHPESSAIKERIPSRELNPSVMLVVAPVSGSTLDTKPESFAVQLHLGVREANRDRNKRRYSKTSRHKLWKLWRHCEALRSYVPLAAGSKLRRRQGQINHLTAKKVNSLSISSHLLQ